MMLRSLAQLAVRRTGGSTAIVVQRLAAPPRFSLSVTRQQQQPLQSVIGQICLHSTSSTHTNNNHDDNDNDNNNASSEIMRPPDKLTTEMAEGIAETTKFYVRHGLAHRRLRALAVADTTETLTVVQKWQCMMEIFLTTQVHVIAGMGYTPDEQGLTQYAHALQQCIQDEALDETMQELFAELRRDTWRELVATAFDLNVADIPVLSIVDARNIMHKVSSKMMEPSVLLEIQNKTAKLRNEDDYDMELANKHQVLQDIIVNHVYMAPTGTGSGSSKGKTLVEESGFGPGAKGYAALQCAMTDFEGDPLIGQYAAAAMTKVWEAAGLDISSLQQQQQEQGGPA
jgi:hypothetical protein